MSRQGIVTLPPLRVDLAISRSCARGDPRSGTQFAGDHLARGRENFVGGGGPVLAECPTAISETRGSARSQPHVAQRRHRWPTAPTCSSTSSIGNDLIERWSMARAMGFHARETLGTPFHPDMRCISALLRVRSRAWFRSVSGPTCGQVYSAWRQHASCFLPTTRAMLSPDWCSARPWVGRSEK